MSVHNEVRFDFIRYANCWEDADILLEALRIKRGDNCLSVASAGDNTLALLLKDPELVMAVDFNPAQLACLELRMAAFANLDYDETLRFIGIDEEEERKLIFRDLRSCLSEESRKFWESHPEYIDLGIIHAGKFENYFRIIRRYMLPLIHGRRHIDLLLDQKELTAQKVFYERVWNNDRWKLLFKIFFSKVVIGRFGRDPKFFRYVEENVALNILKRTEYALTSVSNYSNPYLNYIVKGNFPKHALPLYLRRDSYQQIRKNLHKVRIFKGGITSCIDEHKEIKFDAFNLSDIFEYMDVPIFHKTLRIIHRAAEKGARVAFWNMMVDRTIPSDFPIKTDFNLSEKLHLKDKAFFYKRFIVGSAI